MGVSEEGSSQDGSSEDGASGVQMSYDYASYSNAPGSATLKRDILQMEMSWIATAKMYGVLRKQAAATGDLLCDSSDWSDSQVEIHCAFIKQAAKNKAATT